jgi:hypothetical protein
MTNSMIGIGKAGTGFLRPHGLCIHVWSGKGSKAKNCIHNYECWHCAYDQWIDVMEEGGNAGKNLEQAGDVLAKAA